MSRENIFSTLQKKYAMKNLQDTQKDFVKHSKALASFPAPMTLSPKVCPHTGSSYIKFITLILGINLTWANTPCFLTNRDFKEHQE